jgi:hypothetical protein
MLKEMPIRAGIHKKMIKYGIVLTVFMSHDRKVVIYLLVMSIIVGVVFYFIFEYQFTVFFASQNAAQSTPGMAAFLATGMAAGAFTISMLIYPLKSKIDKSYDWEDFK